jgi:hypothetical protein
MGQGMGFSPTDFRGAWLFSLLDFFPVKLIPDF